MGARQGRESATEIEGLPRPTQLLRVSLGRCNRRAGTVTRSATGPLIATRWAGLSPASAVMSVAELLSQRTWRRLGAEQDAYMTVDSIGTPFAGGGLNTGLRDLARFAEMLRNDGRLNGQQIVPKSVIDDIRKGGDRDAFAKGGYALLKGWSYRNMWWVTHNEHGAYTARGVHGQRMYIDPHAEMVIVRYASHPVASNAANDPTTLPAFDAVAEYLLSQHR